MEHLYINNLKYLMFLKYNHFKHKLSNILANPYINLKCTVLDRNFLIHYRLYFLNNRMYHFSHSKLYQQHIRINFVKQFRYKGFQYKLCINLMKMNQSIQINNSMFELQDPIQHCLRKHMFHYLNLNHHIYDYFRKSRKFM